MSEDVERRLSARSARTVLGTFILAVGVMLMHTVVPVPTTVTHEAMSTNETVTAPTRADEQHVSATHTADADAALMQVPCPSGHEMMHPCIGTITVFPAMPAPTGVVESLPMTDDAADRMVAVVARADRAPPRSMPLLDESVLLRV